jgi:MSHA biogenesis protein MshI
MTAMLQVNLYRPAQRGLVSAVSARSAATAMLTIAAALLAMWGFAAWQVHRMSAEASIARSHTEAQRLLAVSAGSEFAGLSDEALEARVATMEVAVDMRNKALSLLESESSRHAAFADRLAGLARQHIDGVWLDRVTLGASRESISLSGSTLAPDLVPHYLHSLARDPTLRGGDIDSFVIDRPTAASSSTRLHFRAASRGAPQPTDKSTEG